MRFLSWKNMPSTSTMTACTCSFDNACKYSAAERMSARFQDQVTSATVESPEPSNARNALSEFKFNQASRAEFSNSDVEASSVSLERLPPVMRVEAGSDSSSRRMIMLRKTAIALLAVASVGLAAPTMALARGGGGGKR